jgi:hypothetical protein
MTSILCGKVPITALNEQEILSELKHRPAGTSLEPTQNPPGLLKQN